MGHTDGSVSVRYAHVTLGIRKRLMAGLTKQWEAALDDCREMCPTSPVGALNDLLRARAVAIRESLVLSFFGTGELSRKRTEGLIILAGEAGRQVFDREPYPEIGSQIVPRTQVRTVTDLSAPALTCCFSCRGGGI